MWVRKWWEVVSVVRAVEASARTSQLPADNRTTRIPERFYCFRASVNVLNDQIRAAWNRAARSLSDGTFNLLPAFGEMSLPPRRKRARSFWGIEHWLFRHKEPGPALRCPPESWQLGFTYPSCFRGGVYSNIISWFNQSQLIRVSLHPFPFATFFFFFLQMQV